jgi:hypothetical protein
VNIFATYVVMLFVVLASVPAPALEPLALYDDFSGTRLDPAKWRGSEFGEWGSDAKRGIRMHRLELLYIGDCETTSNNVDCESILQVNFTNPTAVTAIQAVITPMQAVATGCASNQIPTFAAARLYGAFFNTGAPTPGSHVNDVVARIQVGRSSASTDPAHVLRANARVYRCLHPDCLDATDLYLQDMGPIMIGERTTLGMQWAQTDHAFIFVRDNQPAFIFPYALSDVTPPGRPDKRLDATVDVPGCTATSRPEALIQVFIDNVFVNQSAASSQ